eukprot:UN25114
MQEKTGKGWFCCAAPIATAKNDSGTDGNVEMTAMEELQTSNLEPPFSFGEQETKKPKPPRNTGLNTDKQTVLSKKSRCTVCSCFVEQRHQENIELEKITHIQRSYYRNKRTEKIQVVESAVRWSNGCTGLIKFEEGSVVLTCDGMTFKGKITPQEDIEWEDEDVWEKETLEEHESRAPYQPVSFWKSKNNNGMLHTVVGSNVNLDDGTFAKITVTFDNEVILENKKGEQYGVKNGDIITWKDDNDNIVDEWKKQPTVSEWLTEDDIVCRMSDKLIVWENRVVQHVTLIDDTVTLEEGGILFTGVIRQNEIHWSDGDVWIRQREFVEPEIEQKREEDGELKEEEIPLIFTKEEISVHEEQCNQQDTKEDQQFDREDQHIERTFTK